MLSKEQETKLFAIYNEIGKKLGITGKIEMAKMTNVPSTAIAVKATPETLKKFRDAYKSLTGEECPIR